MTLISKAITYIIMACCAAGGLASIFKSGSGLARAFQSGINVMGAIFLPAMGLMASAPYLKLASEAIFGRLFSAFGIAPVMGTALLVPADVGGYAMILEQAATPEIASVAMIVSITAASGLVFTVPYILAIIKKEDYPYAALGIMSGFLSIPFCVVFTSLAIMATKPAVRVVFSTTAASDHVLMLNFRTVLVCLLPIIIFCAILAVLLRRFPNAVIKAFIALGKAILAALTLVAVASIIEYYTGIFSRIFGNAWLFDPIIADQGNSFRAIELIGTIAMMLSGAFPMVYLLKKFAGKKIEKIGSRIGLDDVGSAGLLATMADANALFPMIGAMKPESKVVTLAFTICAGYSLGTWLAYVSNFQPNLVLPVLLGQVGGGIVGIVFARIFAIPQLRKMK